MEVNRVVILKEVTEELRFIPAREQIAIQTAIEKLQIFGASLGHPHSSQVKGTGIRELRPRAGRSPWRVFYQQRGDRIFLIGAVGPEALQNPRGFRRAVAVAIDRIDRWEDEHEPG